MRFDNIRGVGEAYVHGYHEREQERLLDQARRWSSSSTTTPTTSPAAVCSRPDAASARRRSPSPAGVPSRRTDRMTG